MRIDTIANNLSNVAQLFTKLKFQEKINNFEFPQQWTNGEKEIGGRRERPTSY
jgi:hypothetical protein